MVTEMTEVAVYDIISSRQTLPLQFDVSYATYQFPKYFAGRTGTYKNRSFFQRLGNVRSVTFLGQNPPSNLHSRYLVGVWMDDTID